MSSVFQLFCVCLDPNPPLVNTLPAYNAPQLSCSSGWEGLPKSTIHQDRKIEIPESPAAQGEVWDL